MKGVGGKNHVEGHLQEGGHLSRDVCEDSGENGAHRKSSRRARLRLESVGQEEQEGPCG